MSVPKDAGTEIWYIVRKRNFLKSIPADDKLMAVIVPIYTTSMMTLYLTFKLWSTLDFHHIAPEDEYLAGRRLGILNVLGETAMQTTLWGNKVCLLLLYNRLTLLGHEHIVWVLLSAFVGLSYLAVIISLYGGWCRPFSDYLVLQPQNAECLTWFRYNILQLSMNLSTDMVLLLVPVTLIVRMKMEIGRKLLLVALFSMGIFVMLSAILLKVAVFKNMFDPVWLIWCVRELSTAMLVSNLILCMPILKTSWWFLSSRIGGSRRKRVPAPGASETERIARDSQSAGTMTAMTTSDSGYSKWGFVEGAAPSPRDHGRMFDVDLDEPGGGRATGRRLSARREDV
ncbi:hypothetical protein LX36DRAFT_694015 [Colletotrichum falcatum]|nr:hypothetical protein LX36DRAFT_694015 [Colletotrichum falcatum]